MKKDNSQEHCTCIYYGHVKNPIVEVCNFERGTNERFSFNKNKIIFILEGRLRFRYNNFFEKEVTKGEFFFIPSSGEFNFTILSQSLVMFIRLRGDGVICEGCNVELLYKDKKENYRQEGVNGSDIKLLKINPLLWHFVSGLNEYITDGLINCCSYFDTKIKELLIILRTCYSINKLQDFFSLILSPDMEFLKYVKVNHYKYKTVAGLAGAMNMTPKYFSKKFVEVFGETPLRWMTKEKARRVYADLYAGNKTIMQIADEHGFSSQQHLNKFCNREFGKNPGKIKKEKNV